MTRDMNNIMTKLFTVIMLLFFSMGASADVKVLYGEKGAEKFEGTGGTIEVKQEVSKDDPTKVIVYLGFIPNGNYTFDEKSLEVYAVIFPDPASTRAPEISGDPLKLEEDASANGEKHYHVTIDSNLALWVKSASFVSNGAKGYKDDPSDFYYINNQRLPDDGYYFVPTINCFYNDDEDQPHLTTFKTGKDKNSIWRIVQVTVGSGDNANTYYRIIHNKTGKYLLANDAISALGSSNAHRKRVHLETLTAFESDATKDKSLFSFNELNANNKIVAIKSKNVSSGNHSYLNPRGNTAGDFDSYRASGNDRTINNTNGIVGFYGNDSSNPPSGQAGSQWKLETANPTCANPVIKYNDSGTEIQISYPISSDTGWKIYYTTDGSDPNDDTNENRTEITATATLTDLSGVTKVRAIAKNNGWDPSEESVLIASGKTQLIQSKDCEAFYMVPSIVDDDLTFATTTNIPNAKMGWIFEPAGLYCGIQYYYIINAKTNDYLYCSGGSGNDNALTWESSPTMIDRAKFRLLLQADGSYKLIAKYWAAEKPASYLVTKKNGNDKTDAINLSNGADTKSSWNVVAVPNDPKTQFDASFASTTAHYQYKIIQNANSTTYHVLPAATDGGATANTSTEKQEWFFMPVEDSDEWTPYYQIRNATTGEYLYFNGAAGANNTFFTSSTVVVDNEDRYKFVVVKSASTTSPGSYNIIPKALKNQPKQENNSLNMNGSTLRTQNSRNKPASLWNLVQSSFTCAEPTITWSAGDNGYVITASEPDAKIYYTTDGTDPTPTTGTLYSGAIQVANSPETELTIKAIAARGSDGRDASSVASVTVSKVATPEITLTEDGKVQIICSTNGASIYYEKGDAPTTLYTGPIDDAAGKVIKAIAVKGGWINSAVTTSDPIKFPCANPVIRKTSAYTFTIECSFPTSGVTIYYTRNGDTPTASSTKYTGTVTFNLDDLPFTVKAIAIADRYNDSEVVEKIISEDLSVDADGYYEIASADDYRKFLMMVNGGEGARDKYKLTVDINASGTDQVTIGFSGELIGVAKEDGTFPVISSLDHPLFNTIDGGIVKNIMLANVSISKSGKVGAIAGVAQGYTRIYNCGVLPSSSLASNDDYCGGLVGWLKDDSRVINCFSYANIGNGTDVAGIVGHNEIASTTEVTDGKYANLRTAVVNCMFYGNITGGSNRYPVYGGAKIVNNTANGINNYDFYRSEASVGTLTDYNCSWPAKEEYLTKYEFYRNLLNSNLELCGWWVGAPSAPSTMTTTEVQAVAKDASLMAKWVLDTSVAPYPILKKFGKYTSPVNIDANASWRESANEWEGKKLGTIKVTINPGIHAASGVTSTSPTDYVITDMDTLRADYCYRKIQLPYYNTVFGNPNGADWAAKYGGNYGDYVVIGWKVSTTEGTTGTLTENWETGYNFADRNCTAKDANRVFAQGGFYYVPEGVENITITAQWASATYIDNTDHSYDRVYMSGSKPGTHFAPAGYRPSTLGNGKKVSTSNFTNIASPQGVFNHAVVLVGNHQYRHSNGSNGDHIGSGSGFTVMSADFDCDDEPDYCLIWQLGQKYERRSFYPIRFDFIPVEEIGLAMKEDGSTQYYSLGCYRPLGHFEVTETSLIHFGQFEFSNRSRTIYAPLILNGGIFDQYTKGTNPNAFETADDKIDYIIIGGNVRIPSFTPGAHVNAGSNFPTRHCAVNVIGGRIDKLYLTGNYHDNISPNPDNPHCYIDGGRIKQVAAAGKEGIYGDVYFKINHSKIWEFYGGSTMDKSDGTNFKIVKGNINVNIDNSIVDKYCGGPKFGDMIYDEDNPENSKTITTNANNTIFGVYYGGGNGGTSYVQYDKTDVTTSLGTGYNWNGTGNDQGHIGNYTAGNYRSGDHNYMADYDMEIVNVSTGTESGQAVFRTYFYAAQFSATNTGPIINNLTDCTVLTNFYGGGNLGGVKGSVTSTLAGTTHVLGSVFGAGYSATIPDVIIHAKDKTAPNININTGIISPQSGGTGDTYTWCGYKDPSTKDEVVPSGVVIPSGVGTGSPSFEFGGRHYFYTEVPLDNLGAVSGAVTLTIKDTTTIDGSVYGGGNASAVINTTSPANASTTVNLQGNAQVHGNVFGGGNEGKVSGSTTVNVED